MSLKIMYFILSSLLFGLSNGADNHINELSEYQRMQIAQALYNAMIPADEHFYGDPAQQLRQAIANSQVALHPIFIPFTDEVRQEDVNQNILLQELWTVSDAMILSEEMAVLKSYRLANEDEPELTEPHEGVMYVMGQYFKRRNLRQEVDRLIPLKMDNRALVDRIFEEFAKASLIRSKDIKLYKDFFAPSEN